MKKLNSTIAKWVSSYIHFRLVSELLLEIKPVQQRLQVSESTKRRNDIPVTLTVAADKRKVESHADI